MFVTCLIIVLTSSVLTEGQTCVKRDACSCVYDDGTGMIDLSSIGNTDGNPVFMDQPSTSDVYWYSYNPCYPFSEGQGTCQNVAACQFDYTYGLYYDIGSVDSAIFVFNGLTTDITYTSSDGGRQTIVTLVCDPAQSTPYLNVIGEQVPGYYSMSLISAAACRVPVPEASAGSGGMSGGSVLLIVFFVLLFVYVIVGVGYNKLAVKATGKDLVPNVGFWESFPGLIKDGFLFTKKIIFTKVLRRSEYESV